MTILVEARPESADQAARTAAGAELAHHVKSAIGVTAKVEVRVPGQVERSLGKAKRVVDLRQEG